MENIYNAISSVSWLGQFFVCFFLLRIRNLCDFHKRRASESLREVQVTLSVENFEHMLEFTKHLDKYTGGFFIGLLTYRAQDCYGGTWQCGKNDDLVSVFDERGCTYLAYHWI